MSIVFPGELDTFTNPVGTTDTLASVPHDQQHSNANDAIEAIEAVIGKTGSTVPSSLMYRIAQLESGQSGQVFNVKDYGAIGNDTADATNAIQDAYDAADAAGGGIVYYPVGTYKTTDVVEMYPSVASRGAGRDISILHQTVINKAALHLANGVGETVASLFIEDLSVEGTGTGTAPG